VSIAELAWLRRVGAWWRLLAPRPYG